MSNLKVEDITWPNNNVKNLNYFIKPIRQLQERFTLKLHVRIIALLFFQRYSHPTVNKNVLKNFE